ATPLHHPLSLHDALPIWSSSTCASLQHSEQSPQLRPVPTFGACASSLMTGICLSYNARRRHDAIRFSLPHLREKEREGANSTARSEEHTSELQSLTNLVS